MLLRPKTVKNNYNSNLVKPFIVNIYTDAHAHAQIKNMLITIDQIASAIIQITIVILSIKLNKWYPIQIYRVS